MSMPTANFPLPEELIVNIFQYLDDYDLQNTRKVSKQFHRLSDDYILWKHQLLERNPVILSGKLFRETRPDRLDLLRQNIIKGLQPHQIENGHYVSGENARRQYEAQTQLNRTLTTSMIRRRLSQRLDVNSLEERGVLPHGFYVDADMSGPKPKVVSALLASRVRQLDRLILDDRLKRALRRRRSYNDLQQAGFITKFNCDPKLIPIQQELEKHFTELAFEEKFSARPALAEKEVLNVLRADEQSLAQMLCPSIRPIIRKFESRSLPTRTRSLTC